MATVALPLAPPVQFDAVIERGCWRGLIINQEQAVVSRTSHTYPTRDKAMRAADLHWRSLRAQNADVDL